MPYCTRDLTNQTYQGGRVTLKKAIKSLRSPKSYTLIDYYFLDATNRKRICLLHPIMTFYYSEVLVRVCTMLVEPRRGPQWLPRMK
jgi:hypothetical protein